MNTRTYQISLGAAVVVCALLAGTLGYLLMHRGVGFSVPFLNEKQSAASQDPVVARGPEAAAAPAASSPDAEPVLAPLQLSAQRMQEIGITSATVTMKNVSDNLTVPGNVDINEQRVSYVQSRFPGWIQDVSVNATYQYVHKGQKLFTIYSPEIVGSQQEYLLARQNQKAFAQDAHGMSQHEDGWLIKAAEDRMQQFGVTQQTINDLEQSGKVQRNIDVESPASGYVIERNALPNAYVQPETKLYTIADLSSVWVYANVFQNDVGRLRPGASAQVTVDAYPERKFMGRVDQILPQVDQATRTVKVRLVFSNPGLVLKPGMYVNVAIAAQLGRQMVVPASAVLQTGTRAIAFLDHGSGSIEPRVIQTGPQFDDSIVVLAGLKPGDKIVSSANFLVDSEAQLQAAAGAFAPPAPPAATAGAPPAARAQIDFSTVPSPPASGANTVRIKLSDADGKPVVGAQASVVFFMAAMPAMGMAAEHATATLADKGNGIYEGSVQLPSGGTWQVTVTAQHGGQTIATKQLNVTATGGM